MRYTNDDELLTALTDPTNVMFVLVEDGEELPLPPLPPLRVLTAESVLGVDPLTAAATEQHTGAMIALVPSLEDVYELQRAVPSDVAEPLEQLHCTLLFLGEADDFDEDTKDAILGYAEELAERQPVVLANVFGFNVWNPDSPKTCVVAALGGDDLEDCLDSVIATLDEADIEYADQRAPWVPHMTLAYTSNPVSVLTSELLEQTGPVVFDRLRVAFAGVTHDFPLQSGLVAHAFHLPGRHNQATHGRGGASPVELAASERMAKGKTLDESDPENAAIASAARAWTAGGNDNAILRGEMQDAAVNPDAQTNGAKFMRVVASAPADSPTLHRGMSGVAEHKIPTEGDVFDLAPTSFTRSEKVRDRFAQPIHSDPSFGQGAAVRIKLAKGSRSVQTSQYAPKKYADEQEHVAMGRFHVTKRTDKRETMKASDGKKIEIKVVEIELTQVEPDAMETTFRASQTTAINVAQIYD